MSEPDVFIQGEMERALDDDSIEIEAPMLPSSQPELEVQPSQGIPMAYNLPFGCIVRMNEMAKAGKFKELGRGEAEARIDILKEAWSNFNRIHVELMGEANRERVKLLTDYMAKAEDGYVFAYAKLKERACLEQSGQVEKNPTLLVNLKNTWGEFDGNIKKWPGFRDRFVAAVHENDDVPVSYKFQYLAQSMVGKAAKTLGEWQLSDKNYQLAWERMVQLYNKKYTICRELLRTFFNLPELSDVPRAAELQKMSNVTHETLRQLKAQDIPVEHWDMLVVHVLHEKLDRATGRQWELARTSETPTAIEMLQFIDQQAAALGDEKPADLRMALRERNRDRDGRERDHRERSRVVERARAKRETAAIDRIPCKCCGRAGHPIWECDHFLSLNMNGRKDIVQRHDQCPNCLKTGHKKERCYQGPCVRCQDRPYHNSTLCPKKMSAVNVASDRPSVGAKRKKEHQE